MKEDWENCGNSLNSGTPINKAWNRVRQLKEHSTPKHRKNIADKIRDTLAKLFFPQNYDHTFLELKQKELPKTLHVKKKIIIRFSQ